LFQVMTSDDGWKSYHRGPSEGYIHLLLTSRSAGLSETSEAKTRLAQEQGFTPSGCTLWYIGDFAWAAGVHSIGGYRAFGHRRPHFACSRVWAAPAFPRLGWSESRWCRETKGMTRVHREGSRGLGACLAERECVCFANKEQPGSERGIHLGTCRDGDG
jgi:hypothetical protein